MRKEKQMKYKAEYIDLGKKVLREKMSELKSLLDEVTEEREMMLGQSGQHIPATRLVKQYRDEIDEINDRIGAITCLLDEGKADVL